MPLSGWKRATRSGQGAWNTSRLKIFLSPFILIRATSTCSNGWACRSSRFFALRVFLHPYPRTRDDVGEIALGGPSQHALSFRWIGHQNRRIPRPPRYDLSPNRASSCVFRGTNDFENGMSPACPQIDGQRAPVSVVGAFFVAASFKVLQRSHVRIGEIVHVNVVADAGAVRSWVVRSEDLQLGSVL